MHVSMEREDLLERECSYRMTQATLETMPGTKGDALRGACRLEVHRVHCPVVQVLAAQDNCTSVSVSFRQSRQVVLVVPRRHHRSTCPRM